jgi:hypothetical protein
MPMLVETSVWIDFTRPKSPQSLKHFIAPFILHADAHLAEPVAFEILRHATPEEHRRLTLQFQTLPLLATPPDLWVKAAELGRLCRENQITAGALDLLIAGVAIHHAAEVLTFDRDFEKIAAVSTLRVKLLQKPGS